MELRPDCPRSASKAGPSAPRYAPGPSGRVDVSWTFAGSHGGVFDNLGEFFRKGVELAEQNQRAQAQRGAR